MANEHEWPKVDGDIDYASEGNSEVGNVVTVEAGETITAGEVVYIHKTDGKAYVSDASTQLHYRADGIAYGAAASGVDVTIRTRGVYYEAAAFADKADYYLGTEGVTNGISTTISGVRLGTALNANELYVDIIQDDRDVVGTIKAWLPDHSGMPAAISANLTAFWKACDGTTISDSESPLNDGGAGEAPNLNGNSDSTRKFLRGATTSDTGKDNTATANDEHAHGTVGGGDFGPDNSTLEVQAASHIPPSIYVSFIMKIK